MLEKKIQQLRTRIDDIDKQILDLINQRLVAAQSIGEVKNKLDTPGYYRPEREAQVLARLHDLNQGLLKPKTLDILFREIMSAARGVEAQLSVAVLGPSGTYTEMAAKQHFGSSVVVNDFAHIEDVFKAVEKRQCDFAVVPVENSIEGGVNSTLDQLVTTPLVICGEIKLAIHHHLLSASDELGKIKKIYAHSLSFGQCQSWLNNQLASAELIPVSSNTEAARRAVGEKGAAAIASQLAAELYGLNALASGIEDNSNNSTRFLVLSDAVPPVCGNDKTSLLLSCKSEPGALVKVLQPLQDAAINMIKIESKPSRQVLWEYMFFIDIVGHQLQPDVQKALIKVEEKSSFFKRLGSYPKALV